MRTCATARCRTLIQGDTAFCSRCWSRLPEQLQAERSSALERDPDGDTARRLMADGGAYLSRYVARVQEGAR